MSDETNLSNQPSTEPEAIQPEPVLIEAAPEPAAEPEVAPVPEPEPEPAAAIAEAPAAAEPAPVGEPEPAAAPEPEEPAEDFGDLLKAFESTHTHRDQLKQLEGTVVSISADQVFLDVGYKMEGALPRSAFPNNGDDVKPGDKMSVSITGRDEGGYYTLSRHRVRQATDWSALEAAFNDKAAIAGTVTAVVKGGLTVDVGVRAFMPASRSGTRDAAEMADLVGQTINCRITKLDAADEDVVVDRRSVLEEQMRAELQNRRASMQVGETLEGTVRTLMPYGAFVDLGGIDGLLHVSDISWSRVSKPEDVLTVGQKVQVRILKIDPDTGKLSLGLKQLQPEPWETAPERYASGQRVSGTVSRLMDFGAFVELEPGVEGLIHVSEMAWNKKINHPKDVLKAGDRVDAIVLSVKPEERRIALGLKQTLADPWLDAPRNFPIGSQVEGPVTKIMNFGAFVEVADGIEGLVHISEIVPDKRVNHPSDELRVGQRVQAMVLGIDPEKRQMKLSIKQLVPTSIDEFIAEHKAGDKVSGRVVEVSGASATVEIGDGIRATCKVPAVQKAEPAAAQASDGKPDLSALSSMLKNRWKGNAPAAGSGSEPLAASQIRSFKIVKLNPDAKKIELELA